MKPLHQNISITKPKKVATLTRDKLEQQIKEYQEKGGQIEKVDNGICTGHRDKLTKKQAGTIKNFKLIGKEDMIGWNGKMENETYKTCSKCKEKKSIRNFPPDKARKDGYKNICRTCNTRQCIEREKLRNET